MCLISFVSVFLLIFPSGLSGKKTDFIYSLFSTFEYFVGTKIKKILKQSTVRCDARCGFYSTLQDSWDFIEIYTDYSINIDISNRGRVDEIKFAAIMILCVRSKSLLCYRNEVEHSFTRLISIMKYHI
jgi:hypothetical protein